EKLLPSPQSAYQKISSILWKRPGTGIVNRFNEQIVLRGGEFRPDIVFFIQARYVLAETIRQLNRQSVTFLYMNDDMFNPANQTFTFHEAIREVQHIFTTKSYNVE